MFTVDSSNRSWQKAKDKAADARPVVQVKAFGDYRVEGSVRGNFYGVTITADGQDTVIDCTCLAGVHGTACYHAAAALTQHLTFIGAPVAQASRNHLTDIARALRTIERAADRMTGDFEEMDAIFKAVRDARNSLEEFELELQPATADAAAA